MPSTSYIKIYSSLVHNWTVCRIFKYIFENTSKMNNDKIYSDYVPVMSATIHSFLPSLCDQYRVILKVLINDIETRPNPFATVKKSMIFIPIIGKKHWLGNNFLKFAFKKEHKCLKNCRSILRSLPPSSTQSSTANLKITYDGWIIVWWLKSITFAYFYSLT